MLDGRIDTQGTVKDLREQGVLESIEHDTAVDAHKEQLVAAEATSAEEVIDVNVTKVAADDDMAPTKKPRKLVKDEHRETGGVKWSIYKSYLEASYVIFFRYQSHLILNLDYFSSYWTWVFLAFLVVVIQILGVSEKLWIKVKMNEVHSVTMGLTVFFFPHRHGAKLMRPTEPSPFQTSIRSNPSSPRNTKYR